MKRENNPNRMIDRITSVLFDRISIILAIPLVVMMTEVSAQVEGLWLVRSVTVQNESMTPVARWTRLLEDNSFRSGNGWLQNSRGSWEYDAQAAQITVEPEISYDEDFGPFSVDYSDDAMTWTREENGEPVTVRWERVEELPKAPADMITGLWLRDPEIGESDETLLVRWDRIYRFTLDNGERKSGFWHMNSHRPTLILLSHGEGDPVEEWAVSFEDEMMVWEGNSSTNRDESRRYVRK